MKLLQQDLWSVDADLIFVTSNSTIKKDGSLVTGKGAALQAAQRYSMLPIVAGKHISHLEEYYLKIFPQFNIGLLQTKLHWKDQASYYLTCLSISYLKEFARYYCGTIACNFPGIGLGGLKRSEVLPIIETLPNNVTICEF
jgi:hypothetical protein